MTKKINKLQIFRHVIQIVLFFLLPALYILTFSELKSIYEMIIKGNFNFAKAFPSLIEFVAVIFTTILLGRFFCGWICAFGAYNDLIYNISKKLFKVKFKINERIDSTLKYIKYLVLALLIVLVWTLGSTLLSSTSPWDVFAQITNFPQVISDYTIGFILLLLITLGAVFVERFFCRYLCPLGAIFTILSKISIFKINKPSDKCGNCKACTNKCSMGLALYKVEKVRGGECINCLQCVTACPRNNAQANLLGENINPTLASSVAIAAFAGVYALNNLGSTALVSAGLASAASVPSSISLAKPTTAPTPTPAVKTDTYKYKDGTYTGSGIGFRNGTTEISVTVKNGKITSLETISSQDTPRFYDNVENAIFDEIISSQSTSVDTISGATYSSKGIIRAVSNALTKAF